LGHRLGKKHTAALPRRRLRPGSPAAWCSVPARCTRPKSMHGMIPAWIPLEVSYLACRVGLWYPRRPAAVRPAIHAPPLPSPPSRPTQGREAAQRAGRALCWATHAMFAASQRLRQRPTPPTASPSRNLGFSSISLNVHVGSGRLAQAALFRWRIAPRLSCKPRAWCVQRALGWNRAGPCGTSESHRRGPYLVSLPSCCRALWQLRRRCVARQCFALEGRRSLACRAF
jgi:hypothetical protein